METKSASQIAAEWLVRWRLPLLVIGLILAAAAYPLAGRLAFDQTLENMFPPGDPELAKFEKFARTFGGDQLVLAVYEDPELMTVGGIERVRALGKRLADELPGVSSAVTIADTPAGVLIEGGNVEAAKSQLEIVEGYLIGDDRRTVAVVCTLVPKATGEDRTAKTVDAIRKLVLEHAPDAAIAGQPVMMVDGFRHLYRDGRRLSLVSSLLLIATIVFLFRSLRWVVIPLVVVQGTLIYSEAAFVLSGLQLSMVSTMFRSVITVTCIAMVIHVVVRVRVARDAGKSPHDALIAAGALLATPIFWTCLTDAAGFGALVTSKVGPVQDYAVMMAIGSLVTLLSVSLLLPGLALFGGFDSDPQHTWGEKRLDVGLDRLVDWIERRGKTVGIVALTLGVALALGCMRLQVETDFTKNFRDDSPIVRSYNIIEDRLGGAGVWDLMLPAPDVLSPEFFSKVRQFQDHLRQITIRDEQGESQPGLTKVLSLVDLVDSQSAPGLQNLLTPEQFDAMIGVVLRGSLPDGGRSLLAEDPETGERYMRVMLRSRERQPAAEKLKLIEEVGELSESWFPGSEATGFFVLLSRLIDGVLDDQWRAFAAATAAIGLMLLVAFRSPVYALLPLLPNALPIVMVLGLLGWLGIKMNLGTVMIAAVSMGLSVDSSIHYLSEFR
ncbi:MAG: MMPL family transporter, partial [Pirellulales bacterium]|nr:MMPL family transporter [Pirellulales bacterium]